jgi:hypothetical protein
MLTPLSFRLKILRTFLGACLIACASLAVSEAQNIEVKAALLGRRIAVGQDGTMVIKVINGRAENPPYEITVEGLKIIKQAESADVKNINGANRVEWIYYYHISGGTEGTFTIPPQTIRVLGSDHLTSPIEITFYEPKEDDLSLNASEPFFARLTLQETDLYEFQMAPVDLAIYVRGANSLDQISPPGLSDSDFIIKPFTRTSSAEIVDIDGWQYTRANIQSAAFPIRSGTRSFGPVDLKVRIVETSQSSSRIIRTVYTQKRAVEMTSNQLELTVKPLPAEGRPANFADTVGSFELNATTSQTTVKVGDPISVDLVVSGIGNFDNVPAPVFQGDGNIWRTYEPKRTQDPSETSDGVRPGRVTFTQIVIPQSGATELPAFTVSYFDPATASYQTLNSPPIPLTIEEDIAMSNMAMAGDTTPGAFAANGASQPTATLTDILSIRHSPSRWTTSLGTITGRWYFWLPQALPACAVLVLLGGAVTRVVRHRIEQRQSPDDIETLESLRRRLRSDKSIVASRQTFFQHLSRCLDAWRSEHPEAESRLAQATSARLAEWEKTIHDSLYSGATNDRQTAPANSEIERANAIINELAGSPQRSKAKR